MKRILVAGVFGVPVLLASALISSKPTIMNMTATVRADEGTCSLDTAAGSYGFTLTGALLSPTGSVPLAAIGRVTLTAQGNVSGTEARNAGGTFANETLTGTFTVNPDCTGAATVMAFESGQLVRTAVLSGVWDDNSNEIRYVAQSVTLPNGTNGTNIPAVLTVEARRIDSAKDN